MVRAHRDVPVVVMMVVIVSKMVRLLALVGGRQRGSHVDIWRWIVHEGAQLSVCMRADGPASARVLDGVHLITGANEGRSRVLAKPWLARNQWMA